jgi:ABC-type multidrug transport system fused ATPase/permease subunit
MKAMDAKEHFIDARRLKNTARLIASMRPYSFEMLLTVVTAFLKHMANIAAACIVAYMTGLAMEGGLKEQFWRLFSWLCVCIVCKASMYYGEMWFGHDVAYRVLKDFRLRLYDKIEEISPAFLLDKHSGRIGATLMGDVEILEWFLAHTFGSAVVAALVTVLLLFGLARIHLSLCGLMSIFTLLVSATPFLFKRQADEQGRDVREKLAISGAVTIEGIHGLRELLTLNSLERYKKINSAAMQNMYDAQINYSRRQGLETMLMHIFTGAFTVMVMGLAASFVADGVIGFKLYPVTVMMSALIFSPIIEICGNARNLGIVFAAASRVQEVFDVSPAVMDAKGPAQVLTRPGDFSFEDVTFSYRPGFAPALRGVGFEAKRGDVIALVGPSGAGKSTCVNLLLRCWDSDSGAIKIGGCDIRGIALNTLHDITCAVLQDVYLFNISVRENIRLGNPEASNAEIESAAKAAFAHEFIVGLPNGYETITGERGFRLSGGQRQRVAIARALLKNSPILILDEAVSSLDSENERFVRRALREKVADRTVLIVAHRLSTIMSADRLIVLNKGRVVQTGTHAGLIAQDGFYKDLVSIQFDGDR